MTEPQVWTLIGVFAAAMFGVLGVTSTLFVKVMNANFQRLNTKIDGLRGEMNSKFERVDTKFELVNTRIDELDSRINTKFELVNSKIDHLDRDVQTLFRRVFPEYPDADAG